MKKFFCAMTVVLMSLSFCGCSSSFYNASTGDEYEQEQEQEQEQKVYGVGDTQTVGGVSLTVTKAESNTAYFAGESEPIKFPSVKVFFKMKNESNEPYTISYLDFTLNDTYTIRETDYKSTNIEKGGFQLVKGNVYEFYAVFDCKYEHTEVDMVFIWETGLFDDKKEWAL